MNVHAKEIKADTSRFVVVEGGALKRALGMVCRVVERRATIPILEHVRLKFDGTRLEIRGTNLEAEIETSVDVVDGSARPWAMCVDAKILAGIARAAGCMNVRIELRDGVEVASIRLGDGEAFYTVSTIDAEDYPKLGDDRGELIEEFSNGQFAAMLIAARPYVSSEETRYYLNGVCWQYGPHGRRMIATDGHRFFACRYAADKTTPKVDRIIPRRVVDVIGQLARGADVRVYEFASDNHGPRLWIDIGDAIIRMKLIDGTFPDVDRVIPSPEAQKHSIRFALADVSAAMDRACAIGSEARNNNTAVKFFAEAGKVAIERRRANNDRSRALTSAAWPSSGALAEFGFNARYFSEILKGCEGEIELRIVESGAPFQISDADETVTRVLMPMRVET